MQHGCVVTNSATNKPVQLHKREARILRALIEQAEERHLASLNRTSESAQREAALSFFVGAIAGLKLAGDPAAGAIARVALERINRDGPSALSDIKDVLYDS